MVLIVPLLVGLSGRRVATTTWVASVVALFGTFPSNHPHFSFPILIPSLLILLTEEPSDGALACCAVHTRETIGLAVPLPCIIINSMKALSCERRCDVLWPDAAYQLQVWVF